MEQKTVLIEDTCNHKWTLAGVTTGVNKIDDESKYFNSHYKKEELVVVTSLYCPKCGKIKQQKVYT